MISHLNVFVPYERVAASHENQLTRALLVVLRYGPMAHQAWLRLVAPEHSLCDLGKAEFATQRQRVLGPDMEVAEGEAVPGISVWLAPTRRTSARPFRLQTVSKFLMASSRTAPILSSLLRTRSRGVRLPTSPTGSTCTALRYSSEEKARSITWQRLLGVLSDLVERDLVSGAERLLISDFLELVEEHFPLIGPYSTLVQCGDNRFRIERRLDAIQGHAVGTDTGKGLGWRDIAGTPKIFMAWLGLSSDNSAVCLRMYPADTLGQSRAFYGDPAAVESVLALRSKGWHVEPNFHWGFMAGGYAWLRTQLAVEEYCAYWINEIGATRESVARIGRRTGRSSNPPISSRLPGKKHSTQSSRAANARGLILDRGYSASTRGRSPRPVDWTRKESLSRPFEPVSTRC